MILLDIFSIRSLDINHFDDDDLLSEAIAYSICPLDPNREILNHSDLFLHLFFMINESLLFRILLERMHLLQILLHALEYHFSVILLLPYYMWFMKCWNDLILIYFSLIVASRISILIDTNFFSNSMIFSLKEKENAKVCSICFLHCWLKFSPCLTSFY